MMVPGFNRLWNRRYGKVTFSLKNREVSSAISHYNGKQTGLWNCRWFLIM